MGILRRDFSDGILAPESFEAAAVNADPALGAAMAAANKPPLVARKFLRLGRLGEL